MKPFFIRFTAIINHITKMNPYIISEPENIRITNVITGAYGKNKPIFSHMDDKYVKATSMYSMEEIHKIAKCSPLMMKEIHDEHMVELQQWRAQQQLQSKQLQAMQLQSKQLQAMQLQAKPEQVQQNNSNCKNIVSDETAIDSSVSNHIHSVESSNTNLTDHVNTNI